MCFVFFFFQAEAGIRDLVRSRGLGDVYKRQAGHGRRRTLGHIQLAVGDIDEPLPAVVAAQVE